VLHFCIASILFIQKTSFEMAPSKTRKIVAEGMVFQEKWTDDIFLLSSVSNLQGIRSSHERM
jgi:hypothetical protein